MAELTVPFDYRSILIGDEIIYRALTQQEKHAQQGKYGREWAEADQLQKSGAYFRSNVMRSDFAIPSEYQHCVPEPPCPWDKTEDKVDAAKINPTIFGSDGVYTHALAVHQRVDGNNMYAVGNPVIAFTLNQAALHASIRSEFSYFAVNEITLFQGPAVFVIQRFHRGTLEREFHYTFELIR
jgi:hypothetical protein